MKRNLYLLIIIFFFIITFTAGAQIKDPNTYVLLTIGEPDSMDPGYAYDSHSGETLTFVYNNLIAYDGENIFKFIPILANAVPSKENGLITNGGKTYIFPIRKGVFFHNGNGLSPDDVEYTFERNILYDSVGGPYWMIIGALFDCQTLNEMVASKIGLPLTDLVNEDGSLKNQEYADRLIKFYHEDIDPAIEVKDDKVIFHLAKPFAPFLSLLSKYAYWSSIMDKQTCIEWGCWDGKADGWWKYYNQKKESSPLFDKTNGTGPFILTEWDRTQQKVVLKKNQQYWGEKAKLEQVIIWGVDEWNTRRAMFEAGDADQVYVPTQYIQQLENLKESQVYQEERITITNLQFNWTINKTSPFLGSAQLDGNGIPPDFFSDENCRRAFCYAFDYEAMINDVLQGYGKRIASVLPSDLLGYNDQLPRYEYDLIKAKEEFQKAWDGKVWDKGFQVTLAYDTGNEVFQTACEILKENIESLNPQFKIGIQGIQWPSFLDSFKLGQLPAIVISWIADYPDPHNLIFSHYHSNGAIGGAQGEGFAEFAKNNLNQQIDAALSETNPEVRKKLYENIQIDAYEHALGIPLFQPVEIHLMKNWVKDWVFNPIQCGEANYDTIYKKE